MGEEGQSGHDKAVSTENKTEFMARKGKQEDKNAAEETRDRIWQQTWERVRKLRKKKEKRNMPRQKRKQEYCQTYIPEQMKVRGYGNVNVPTMLQGLRSHLCILWRCRFKEIEQLVYEDTKKESLNVLADQVENK